MPDMQAEANINGVLAASANLLRMQDIETILKISSLKLAWPLYSRRTKLENFSRKGAGFLCGVLPACFDELSLLRWKLVHLELR